MLPVIIVESLSLINVVAVPSLDIGSTGEYDEIEMFFSNLLSVIGKIDVFGQSPEKIKF